MKITYNTMLLVLLVLSVSTIEASQSASSSASSCASSSTTAVALTSNVKASAEKKETEDESFFKIHSFNVLLSKEMNIAGIQYNITTEIQSDLMNDGSVTGLPYMFMMVRECRENLKKKLPIAVQLVDKSEKLSKEHVISQIPTLYFNVQQTDSKQPKICLLYTSDAADE